MAKKSSIFAFGALAGAAALGAYLYSKKRTQETEATEESSEELSEENGTEDHTVPAANEPETASDDTVPAADDKESDTHVYELSDLEA